MSVHSGSHVWSKLLIAVHEEETSVLPVELPLVGTFDPSRAVRRQGVGNDPSARCCRGNPLRIRPEFCGCRAQKLKPVLNQIPELRNKMTLLQDLQAALPALGIILPKGSSLQTGTLSTN